MIESIALISFCSQYSSQLVVGSSGFEAQSTASSNVGINALRAPLGRIRFTCTTSGGDSDARFFVVSARGVPDESFVCPEDGELLVDNLTRLLYGRVGGGFPRSAKNVLTNTRNERIDGTALDLGTERRFSANFKTACWPRSFSGLHKLRSVVAY